MAKKKAPKVKKVLEALSADYYQEVFQNLVHFSFKTVNSNTDAGGIRLSGKDSVPDLGYITARGLLAEGSTLELDYTKNFGKVATALKHLRIAKQGSDTEELSNPELPLTTAEQVTSGRHEIGTDHVAPRLRQLLLPLDHSQQNYLSVTPLVAAGLCKHVKQAVIHSNQSRSETGRRRITTAHLGIGGTNSQNVGSLVREMQSPMFFDAPTESLELKNAYKLHYQGLKLLLPRTVMQAYFEWRHKALKRGGGRVSSSLRARETELGFITQLVEITLQRADRAHALLTEHLASLPGQALVDPALDLVQRGLLDPAARTSSWRDAFSATLAERIAMFRFSDDRVLGVDQSGQSGIAAMIVEVLA
ncbi:MAG: hypothetical protein MI976_08080 [Pseudomonadales bacterium]|nr:hypothetical protein [Pseudomonadales bacterium]